MMGSQRRKNAVLVAGFVSLVFAAGVLAAKSWQPPSVQSALTEERLRQTPRTSVVGGLGSPALELCAATKTVGVSDSGRSLAFAVAFAVAFLGLALGGWIWLCRTKAGNNWRFLAGAMMGVSLLFAYLATAAMITPLERPSVSITRKQGQIRLLVNSWGSVRCDLSIGLERDPRIAIYSEYSRRAHHDVALVWRTSQGVDAVWLASDFEDYDRALQFARKTADGADLPFDHGR